MIAGVAALVQANGTIGDGPYGATSGDYDAYSLQVSAGNTLTASVDTSLLGSGLVGVVEIYDSAGTLVATNGGSFLQYDVSTTGTYTVVVHGQRAGNQLLSDPFNSASGPGVGSTGDYRVLINTSSAADDPRVSKSGTSGIVGGGNGPDVLYNATQHGFAGNSSGGGGNDLLIAQVYHGTPGDTYRTTLNGGPGFDVAELDVPVFGPGPLNVQFNQSLVALGGNVLFSTSSGSAQTNGNTNAAVTMQSIEAVDIRLVGSGSVSLTIGDLTGTTLTGQVQVVGSGGADTIEASASINGLRFLGRGGADTYYTRSGTANADDYIDGGAGFDTFTFVRVNSGAVTLNLGRDVSQNTGGAGEMTVRNFEYVIGSLFADTLIGGDGDDMLNGAPGNDTLTGGGAIGPWGSRGAIDRIGDFNGDRRADILQLNANGAVDVWSSTGRDLDNLVQWTTGSRPVDQIGDFNGDGRDDLIQLYDGNNNAYVWLSSGSGFNAYTQWGTGFSSNDHVADLNGDGRDDIVQFYRGTAYAWLSNGTSFNNYSSWGTGFRSADQFADFDGDGRADVVQLHENGNAYVWLSNGNSFGNFSTWGTGVTPNDRIADVDGDGRADIIQIFNQTAYVWLSNGSSFGNYTAWGTGFRATDQFADFDGDGRADAIQLHENGNAYVSLSTGSAFSGFSVWGSGVTANDRIADVNGDGRSDVIQLAGNGNAYVWLSTGSGFTPYEVWGRSGVGTDTFYFTGASGQDLITDFHAGQGVGDVIKFDPGRFANFDAVLALTSDDGAGNTIIRMDANNQITLLNVTVSMLAPDDFLL